MNEVGQALENNGYIIKTLNLVNFAKSNKYNPFDYISKEHPQQDILVLVDILITNTSGKEQKTEDFWVKSERLLYTALIAYLYYEGAPHEKNFGMLVYLLQQFEVREDDENFKNPIDFLFENLENREQDHFAVRQYKSFKLAAGKTVKSILISCAARLAPFDIAELRTLTEEDELQMDTLGDKKTALFVIISDTTGTFNFIAAMMYSQLFNRLCTIADDKYGGRLPIPVRCLLDEFANIGQIPDFEKLITTIRSREISASIILQAKSQLKALYKDNANTIVGNCDSFVYLGGKDEETLKSVVEILGKETIDSLMINVTKGRDKSTQQNNSILGRELLTTAELAKLPRDSCIVQIKGLDPFKSKKYDLLKHPNYSQTGDADSANMYEFKNTAIMRKEETEAYFADVTAVEEVDLSEIDFDKLENDSEKLKV